MAHLLYEVKDGIGWIRFNRPEVLNAFDPPEVRRLVEVLQEAADDPEVKAIIIGSVGKAFSAGDDLKVAMEEYPQIKSGEIHPILDIVEDITENLQEIPRIIRKARKVVISCVRGHAVGAGFEVAIDSDLVVAAESAIFGFPESNAGMTITGGASQLLPLIVGLNKARELVLTGEFIDAAEGYRIGLVNKLVKDGEEEAAAEELARRIMSRAPLATVAHKRMLNAGSIPISNPRWSWKSRRSPI
ncbi:enoyl-CoA hydratase/isomerase family protein [Roseovarius indicus]|uniref:enoyl-CoA hydratase/isomerase family protein n=1 Tax=Roseovarius indicus TaxID=540747 RepID=UPI0032EC341A